MTNRSKKSVDIVDEEPKQSTTTNETSILKAASASPPAHSNSLGTRFKFANILEKSVSTVVSIMNNPSSSANTIDHQSTVLSIPISTNAKGSFPLDELEAEADVLNSSGEKKNLFKACIYIYIYFFF